MCTVTFIPVRNSFIITANRDEKNSRAKAIPPSLYDHNGCKLIYPKDLKGGGTWIAIKENGHAAVLLNGAFIAHVSQPPYRKSRGALLIDVISAKYPAWTFSKIDLLGIEPFTLIVFERNSLYEFRWDGIQKYCRQLPNRRAHIWSSATLYDGLVHKKRELLLAKFLNRTPVPSQLDILNFHQFGYDDVSSNGLIMEGDEIYSTVSITALELYADRGIMKYFDLKDNVRSEMNIVQINAA